MCLSPFNACAEINCAVMPDGLLVQAFNIVAKPAERYGVENGHGIVSSCRHILRGPAIGAINILPGRHRFNL